jgi:hypothetical protein
MIGAPKGYVFGLRRLWRLGGRGGCGDWEAGAIVAIVAIGRLGDWGDCGGCLVFLRRAGTDKIGGDGSFLLVGLNGQFWRILAVFPKKLPICAYFSAVWNLETSGA